MKNPVQLIDPPPQEANALLSDFRWASAGGPLVIEYSFLGPDAEFFIDPRYGYDPDNPDYDLPFRPGPRGFSEAERELARGIFQDLQRIIDARFVEVADGTEVDLRLGKTSLEREATHALAFSPVAEFVPFAANTEELHSPSPLSGDIWLGHDIPGDLLWLSMARAIGRALGLSPGHENGFDIAGNVAHAVLDSELDYLRYSVLSRHAAPEALRDAELLRASMPATYMPLDIQALQYFYGPARDSGHDLHIVGDAGEPLALDGYEGFSVHRYPNAYVSLFDGDGHNVLAFQLDEPLTINLEPGAWSRTGGGLLAEGLDEGNFHLAPGTALAELLAGAGDDSIFLAARGGQLARARGGADRVYDGGGDDWVLLGEGIDYYLYAGGVDEVDGGQGVDVVDLGDLRYTHFRFIARHGGSLLVDRIDGEGSLALSAVEFLVMDGMRIALRHLHDEIAALNRQYLVDDEGPLWQSALRGASGALVPSLEAQLYRMYFGALGRAPDRPGYDWWLGQLERGVFDFGEVAARFVDSAEFESVADQTGDGALTDLEFLLHVYGNVFGRDPDGEGFAWWHSRLQLGEHDHASAFASMVQSDEFVLLTAGTASDYLFV